MSVRKVFKDAKGLWEAWVVDHTGRFRHHPSASPVVIVWKVVGQHLFLNIIPSNFTAETGRKVWCDQGMSRGSLQLERSGDYDNVMSEVEAPGLSYPRHQLCSSYEFCFHRVCQWGGRRGKEGRGPCQVDVTWRPCIGSSEFHQLEFGFRYHCVISVSMSQSL